SPRSDVLRLLMELWCFALPPPLLGKLTLLHPLQLLGIVGTEDPHLIRVLAVQLAQPPLVRHPRAPIDLHHLLVEAQARRTAVSGAIDLTAVEVRVPGVEQPSLVLLHRDSGVPRGVSGEGNEQQLGGESTQLPR